MTTQPVSASPRQNQGTRNLVRSIVDALQRKDSSPYWRALPMRRTVRLLLGAFLLASVIGFSLNLYLIASHHPVLLHGFFWPLFIPCLSTSLLVVRLRNRPWGAFASLIAVGALLITLRIQLSMPGMAGLGISQRDLLFNAFGTLLGAGLGMRLMISFLGTEGVTSVRMQTELSLAQGIQATLAPPVSLKTPRFEVYGISLPSAEVGGDLVDAVAKDGELLAYVADVSGHGLPAGQLMGMLKTAMRVSIELQQGTVALFENADRVLPTLKQPEMYATLALLRFDSSAEAEYSLAGHPPILHYRRKTNDVVQLAMQQFPIGMFGDTNYASARTRYSEADLFLILTDGIIEAANESGEEFGLGRVERLMVSHATQPLSEIWKAIRGAAIAWGAQHDDQSALFVRAL